jgi:hypothetical protein
LQQWLAEQLSTRISNYPTINKQSLPFVERIVVENVKLYNFYSSQLPKGATAAKQQTLELAVGNVVLCLP